MANQDNFKMKSMPVVQPEGGGGGGGVTEAELAQGLATKQDVIDNSHKLNANLVAEQTDKHFMSDAEQTKLANLHNYDDTAVRTLIGNETTRAQGVENAINEKIPNQASAQNQLADKEYVNTSIATNTATFKGTYTNIADLPATGVDNNDYAFIRTVDALGNISYSRYKYTEGTGWGFEYTLNNSSFTAEQWAALNSGITENLVGKITNNENNINGIKDGIELDSFADVEAALEDKQDKLSATNKLSSSFVQFANDELFTNTVNMTYAELATLKSQAGLVPGRRYRITDYQTIIRDVPNISVANNVFDIIVEAISTTEFDENARADMREGTTYFAKNNLRAWKLKYSFDNLDTKYFLATSTGKGVIYELTDEFGNQCAYDFKNLKFIRYNWTSPDSEGYHSAFNATKIGMKSMFNNIDYPSIGTLSASVAYYTFDYNGKDYSLNIYTQASNNVYAKYCYNNVFKPVYIDRAWNVTSHFRLLTPNNVVYIAAAYNQNCMDNVIYGYDGTLLYSHVNTIVEHGSNRFSLASNDTGGQFHIHPYCGQIQLYGKYGVVGASCSDIWGGNSILTIDHNTQNLFTYNCSARIGRNSKYIYLRNCYGVVVGDYCDNVYAQWDDSLTQTLNIPNNTTYVRLYDGCSIDENVGITKCTSGLQVEVSTEDTIRIGLINHTNADITVTGEAIICEWDDYTDINTDVQHYVINKVIPAGTNTSIIEYSEDDYGDAYTRWSIKWSIGSAHFAAVGDYD